MIAGSLGACTLTSALASPGPSNSLTDLSLEHLANLQVTSVSRHAERLDMARFNEAVDSALVAAALTRGSA